MPCGPDGTTRGAREGPDAAWKRGIAFDRALEDDFLMTVACAVEANVVAIVPGREGAGQQRLMRSSERYCRSSHLMRYCLIVLEGKRSPQDGRPSGHPSGHPSYHSHHGDRL
jgi:hypothetical protein